MIKLNYGNGSCTITGSDDISVVMISYNGAIEIDNKNPEHFVIAASSKKIIIAPLTSNGILNDLFDYVGNFTIKAVKAFDKNNKKVNILIKRHMDFSELLNTKSEDMTTRSEELKAGHTHDRVIRKTVLKQPHIENLNTATHRGTLYLKDGSEYNGSFHIHISDSAAMTGGTHNSSSQYLYYKQLDKNGEVVDKLISTKNPSHIPPIPRWKKRKTGKTGGARSGGVSGGGARGGGGY